MWGTCVVEALGPSRWADKRRETRYAGRGPIQLGPATEREGASDVVWTCRRIADLDLQLLHAFAKERHLPPPRTLWDAVRLTARIGGSLARNHDPPPHHQLMWRVYARLQAWGEGFALRGE
jgi:hypothetical protein